MYSDQKMQLDFDSDNPLMSALDFTIEDIHANRSGVMSEKQLDFLRNERSWWRLLSVIILVAVPVLIAITILDGIYRQDTVASRIGIIGFIFVIAGALYFYSHSIWKQFHEDVLEGCILSVEGGVKLRRYRERHGMKYTLLVEAMKFGIKWRAFNAFEDGGKYRIYYSKHSRRIMSAEPAREPSHPESL